MNFLLPSLFSVALFVNAALLFLVEPLIARMILPLLGGSPAVWNTCMVFFQANLLLGYGYAHLLSRKIPLPGQIAIHLLMVFLGLLVLPLSLPSHWLPSPEGNPIYAIVYILIVSIGLPFFVLSANSILLQKWFAESGHLYSEDPYFLYSASNLGSMMALIAYPAVVEPYLKLNEQSRLWTEGYIILVLLAVSGSIFPLLRHIREKFQKDRQDLNAALEENKPTYGRRLYLVILAFVPSSLMLGVTSFVSTDVAAIPLFWILPLTLYLLSFIIVFARIPAKFHKLMIKLLPLTLLSLIFVTYADVGIPKWVTFLFHLGNFFIYALVCHGEIARLRPQARHLTEFYLLISFGGVLGGMFNALIAPFIFKTVLEYPFVLILGALILPLTGKAKKESLLGNLLWYSLPPLILTLITYTLIGKLPLDFLKKILPLGLSNLKNALTYLLLLLLCLPFMQVKKKGLFGLCVAALLLTIVFMEDTKKEIVYRTRSFFGVLTVAWDEDREFAVLYHGTTIHGKQWLEPDKWSEPTAYYHREGPVGQVFSALKEEPTKKKVAVFGLGVGTIAAYINPGEEIHFYEIDPAVKKIATDPFYFSYLHDCRGSWKIVLGDARLTFAKAPPEYYNLLILDAFSSDAIPVHLITKEAMELYLKKLNQKGLILVHISNKYVNLAPMLGKMAQDMGLIGRICEDDEEIGSEKYSSTWVLLARQLKDLGSLARSKSWEPIKIKQGIEAWSDDFSNLLALFKWH